MLTHKYDKKHSHLLHHNAESSTEQTMCAGKIDSAYQTRALENEIGLMVDGVAKECPEG